MSRSTRRRAALTLAFELAVVLAYGAWALHGFSGRLDFEGGDEAVYYRQGCRLNPQCVLFGR